MFGFPLVRKWAITTLLIIPVIRVAARRLANLLLSYCVVSGSVVYAPRTLVRHPAAPAAMTLTALLGCDRPGCHPVVDLVHRPRDRRGSILARLHSFARPAGLFPGAARRLCTCGKLGGLLPSAFQVVVLPHSLSWLDPAYGAYGAMMKGRWASPERCRSFYGRDALHAALHVMC